MLIVDVAPIAGLWPCEVVRTPAAARAPLNHFGLLAGMTPRQALACIHRYVSDLGGTDLIVAARKGTTTFLHELASRRRRRRSRRRYHLPIRRPRSGRFQRLSSNDVGKPHCSGDPDRRRGWSTRLAVWADQAMTADCGLGSNCTAELAFGAAGYGQVMRSLQ